MPGYTLHKVPKELVTVEINPEPLQGLKSSFEDQSLTPMDPC